MFKLPPIAVDIGSSAIKIVELSGGHQKKLRSVGIELVPEGVINEGFISDIPTAQQALKRLVKRLRLSTMRRRACLSLGGNSVIVKKVNFPNKDEAELADMIEAEAEQHFQHDIDDLHFDWHILDPNPNQQDRSVVLIGAKRDIIDQHISVAKSVGLKIAVIECDVFATFNMFEYNFGMIQGLIALTNIGASSAQVSLIGNGQHLYTRDIAIAGNNYTKALSTALNIAPENAEAVKIAASEGGASITPDVQNVIAQVNKQLVSEIQVTTDFFFQSGEAPLDFTALSAIFLTGGASRTIGLDSAIASAMNIPVNIINPFHKIDIPRKFPMESILSQGHLYGIGVGLSLRDVEDNV
ncbi:MAG: type IV pilus assembly protein PilM [Oligoflexales bacterium]|nr:type IV pilus assembly protein PilM [Oligoflexales bacterium]